MNNVENNKQAKLSEHMTLGELTKTKHVTADQKYPKIYIKDLQTSWFIITFASMKENNNTKEVWKII